MKKHLLKFFVSLTVVLLFVGFNSQSVFADTSSDGRWEYTDDGNGGVKITKYNGSQSEVDVPTVLDGKPVTTIGYGAFYNNIVITKVSMPSVTLLENGYPGVFQECTNLQSVDMPNVETIGDNAFWNCSSIQGVDLSNVTTIGLYAFYKCSSLQGVDLSNVTTIGERTFSGCSNLQSVNMPNVITIGYCSFDGCKLQSVDIPNATTLGKNAFLGCTNLQSVDMPNVETIGEGAFHNCLCLKSANMPNVTTIVDDAFDQCYYLESANMPNVTTIGDTAFRYCSGLNSVTILGNPTLGEKIFYKCHSKLKIYCYEGTNIHTYAQTAGISFVLLVKATSISLNETSLKMDVGDNKNLSVTTVEPTDAYTYINWTSSDTDVVVVDNTGKITAKGDGTATITATDAGSNCSATCIVTVGGTTPNPTPDPAPTPGHNHNWEWGTITEPTEYSDGMEGYICTICGATKDTVTIPSTGVFMENKYNQVKNAKAGETVVLEMGPWHSLSKGFMEEIAKRRDVTFVIHFIYEGKKYEVVIPAGRPLVLDPSIDWYGPLKQNEMFGMKEIM